MIRGQNLSVYTKHPLDFTVTITSIKYNKNIIDDQGTKTYL